MTTEELQSKLKELQQELSRIQDKVYWRCWQSEDFLIMVKWQAWLGGQEYGRQYSTSIPAFVQARDPAGWRDRILKSTQEDISRVEAKTGLKFAVG